MFTLCMHTPIGVCAIASGLMSLHYGDILQEFDACPLPLLCGAPSGYCNSLCYIVTVWLSSKTFCKTTLWYIYHNYGNELICTAISFL